MSDLKPMRVTLRKNHNERWALRFGDLEWVALRSMLCLAVRSRWIEEHHDSHQADAIRRICNVFEKTSFTNETKTP